MLVPDSLNVSGHCSAEFQHDSCCEIWCECPCHDSAGGILHRQTVRMFGPIPGYIPYLHQLLTSGHYTYMGDGRYMVYLCWIDRNAFDQLKDVNSVILEYGEEKAK